MTRHLGLLLLLMLLPGLVLAQQPTPTYTIAVGQFPWYDRVNQWALSAVPAKYLSDKPVPQQSCNQRDLVVPAGTKQATIAVLDKQLAEFLQKQTGSTDTGDKLEIKQGAGTLSYAIVTVTDPPATMTHRWMSAGLILLALDPPYSGPATAAPAAPAAAPVAPAAPVAAPAPTAPAAPAAGKTYSPANKAEPWHDRAGRWVIGGLPEQFANLPPVPQQSCDNKTLILPAGTKSVTIAVSDTDLPEFQKRYPQIKDTGFDIRIETPSGSSALPYSIVAFPDPPENGDFRAFAKGGIVLLKLDGAVTPAAPATTPAAATTGGQKQVLVQEQEFAAQEWPGKPGERKVKMYVREPAAGIDANTGLMLVLHNWGGVYNSGEYIRWCGTFADRFNVVAMSVNYLQSGPEWKTQLPYDHGYLQAMDCLRALYTVWKQLKDQGIAFNEHRIYSMGGSGGGNVTEMVMKLAPHTFACGVDICGMPGLIDAIAFGTGEGTSLNAGYSRDPKSPNFLSKDMQEIRDFGNLEHCRLLKAANPNLKIVIVHGLSDPTCPPLPKVAQYLNMLQAKLDVDGRFLTEADVDGTAVTTTSHAVGNREQVVIKYADEYMKPDGKLKKATTGPSDFTRGGTFEYPTSGGKYVIDFTGAPTISFVAK